MDKKFGALDYLYRVYFGFLQTQNDEHCQITLNRSQAKIIVEEIEYIRQSLLELQAIKEVKPSEALECLDKMIRDFNETTTGMNGLGEVVVGNELVYFHKKELDTIAQALLNAQEQEKENVEYKKNIKYQQYSIDKSKEIVKQFNDRLLENENVLKIIFEKKVDISLLMASSLVEDYNNELIRLYGAWSFVTNRQLTQEEFDTLKKVVEINGKKSNN